MTDNISVKIKFTDDAKSMGIDKIAYATPGASCFDVVAMETMYFDHNTTGLVRTGMLMEIPEGYEAQLRSRSGLSMKRKLLMPNGFGTIDADFRGELMVPFLCLDPEGNFVAKGERIAQVAFVKVYRPTFEVVHDLTISERGDGGFGSTGV